ncbi:MAG: SH3 domain-containing protein [Gammaproteobacteria bacterium]
MPFRAPVGVADEASGAGLANRGPVTSLPLPRFVSIKANKAFARRGPSTSQRVDWVFLKKYTPLEITAEYGHWRRVRDADGAGGWMHYALLSGVRTVLVRAEKVELLEEPRDDSEPVAIAEQGVIGRLGACVKLWCEISAGGIEGWVKKNAIWGVGADEIRK